jgi:replication initiation protein RepC
MEPHASTTPFGRRPMSLAQVATQASAKARPPEKFAHKWEVFRAICTAKDLIAINERALSVLNALLSFHPETILSGEGLIVFPSNEQLSLRAHGMAATTLRRQLAALVTAGLIVRRDSPNGKRYARKGRGGEVELAFGFDLAPLVARADEFAALAEQVRADERALKLARERITICRRDIIKMIATGIEEGVQPPQIGSANTGWSDIHVLYQSIASRIPRRASRETLEPIADELTLLADEILKSLEDHIKTQNMDANESQNGRHIQNSNTNPPTEFEPDFRRKQAGDLVPVPERPRVPDGTFPLGMILDACPDLLDYASTGIANWRDFLATVSTVRPMLGISPSAWEEAQKAMGEVRAAVVVACILQKGTAINSAGGYLRGLTRKTEQGEFSMGPMIMALIGNRKRDKRTA